MNRFIGFRPPQLYRYASYGAWALVTGASDGIGKAFAIELALVYGFNVAIHGRNKDKLEGVRQEIISLLDSQGKSRVKIMIIVADASQAQQLDYHNLFYEALSPHKLTLLINNVGISDCGEKYRTVLESSTGDLSAIINTNNLFLSLLTKHMLPKLTMCKPSLIVNISSAASLYPIPSIVQYSASKAFVNAFSTSLNLELSMDPTTQGVSCQCLIVGKVHTQAYTEQVGYFCPSAQDFASQACKVLGDGVIVGPAYFWHALQLSCMYWLPRWLKDIFVVKAATDLRSNLLKNK